jgi:hypothetical protein
MIGNNEVSKALDRGFSRSFHDEPSGRKKSSSAPTRYEPQTRLAFPLRPCGILPHYTIGVNYIDINIHQTLKGTS